LRRGASFVKLFFFFLNKPVFAIFSSRSTNPTPKIEMQTKRDAKSSCMSPSFEAHHWLDSIEASIKTDFFPSVNQGSKLKNISSAN
jgi:hypothetical protein